MIKPLYDFEPRDKTIYDGIREYCLTEKVPEERLRALVKKDKRGGRRAGGRGFFGTCLSNTLSIRSLFSVVISAEGRLE